MAGFRICGGEKIEGTLRVDTAKNAVLPILAASVLPQEDTVLTDCPRLGDVECMRGILRMLGCESCWEGDALRICGGALSQGEMPEELSKRVRSSIFLLGPVLGRLRMATMAYPGGCEIGLRPIDLHLSALKRMGVRISEEGGMLHCDGRDMHAADIHLDYPSVGATENIIMAAALLPGRTTISNAAREPEIEDLQRYINARGRFAADRDRGRQPPAWRYLSAHAGSHCYGYIPVRGGDYGRADRIDQRPAARFDGSAG